MNESNRIEGRAKTLRELMDRCKYTIDFYQREYAWKEQQVRELIDDLSGKFLDFYDPEHQRTDVKNYGHYFLGSIVISHKNSKRYIVDGQQRLTSLTLLLIHLQHRQQDNPIQVDVRSLIYSEEFGQQSFNLNVADRNQVMRQLLHSEPVNLDGATESVRNIKARYDNFAEHFPEEVDAHGLAYFIDWLLNNVHIVEIQAYNNKDAYTIFETMNDRGLSLSFPEMLKGYVLASIGGEEQQRQVNALWKKHMLAFKELGDNEDVDFFKSWLRARYAQTMRAGNKGAENKDYERIVSFHRWVRDQSKQMGLTDSNSYVRFVLQDLDFYAKQTQRIRKAGLSLTPGLESIRYNEERGFTLQTQVLLAALSPEDTSELVHTKLKLIADFLDIWLARRVWNYRTIGSSAVRYTIFTFTRAVRGKTPAELVELLRGYLDAQEERFVTEPKLRLHMQNHRKIRHILARLTHWIDTECGLVSHFDDLVSAGRAKQFEIEHIWANHYDRYDEIYASPSDFDTERNRLGGLILLQQGLNQSLGDATYEDKREAYAVHSENLLARSLNPMAYQNNPTFKQFMARTGLIFKSYEHFGPEEQAERQELYIRLAEWVWNPGRISTGEVARPEHQAFPEPEEAKPRIDIPLSERHAQRVRFWTRLLSVSVEKTQLHAGISPTSGNWVNTGAGRSGLSYQYNVLLDHTRLELYINTNDRQLSKFLYDQLVEHRDSIDEAFGEPLSWERLEDKNTSRIACRLELGGWADDTTWDAVIPASIDAMIRLESALHEHVQALNFGEEG